MGNKLCNCPNICPNYNNETSLSNKINNLISNNSFSNVITANFTINFENESINKKILDIYKKNCVNKIIKAYFNYKRRKNKYKNDTIINNDKKEEETNINKIKKNIEAYDNFDQYSIDHPFYIDKICRAKTMYEKIYIPKINTLIIIA